jgi:hypothetical protein
VKSDLQKERYNRKICQHNFWFTTGEARSQHHFFTVIYPVKPGAGDPVISRLDDYTAKVQADGEVDIISFDKNTDFPATLIVDLEAFRQPVSFGN